MKRKLKHKMITFLIPAAAILIYNFKTPLIRVFLRVPPCPFYQAYHLYCPSCGNTRSVMALLHGHVLASLHYNIIPFILLILGSLAYVEYAFYSFDRRVRILPRRLLFYLILIFILVVYLVVRNFLPFLKFT